MSHRTKNINRIAVRAKVRRNKPYGGGKVTLEVYRG